MKTLTLHKYNRYEGYMASETSKYWTPNQPIDTPYYHHELLKDAGEMVIHYPEEWEWSEWNLCFYDNSPYILELIVVDDKPYAVSCKGKFPLEYTIRH